MKINKCLRCGCTPYPQQEGIYTALYHPKRECLLSERFLGYDEQAIIDWNSYNPDIDGLKKQLEDCRTAHELRQHIDHTKIMALTRALRNAITRQLTEYFGSEASDIAKEIDSSVQQEILSAKKEIINEA